MQQSLPYVLSLCGLIVSLCVVGCKTRDFNQEQMNDSDLAQVDVVDFERQRLLSKHRFDRITPTGEKIFAAALAWERMQELQAGTFAQPAQCANNVSRVFEMAGVLGYSSPLLWNMVSAAKLRGGFVIELPKNTRSIARVIEDYFEGALPVGTLVSGCLNRDCSGEAGDGHISVVGHVDETDALHLYHNNWFRPENRPWRKHMIPLAWYQSGFLRKWMSTPWVSRSFDAQGRLVDIGVVLPEIDDLDPTNYFVTLTVIPEIIAEMKARQSVMTDGQGAVMPFRPRSVSRPTEPIVLPQRPELNNCKKLKTISPMPTNVRETPNGSILCKLPLGVEVELLTIEKNWSRVRAMCSDGKRVDGFALSALLVPDCGN